VLGKATIGAFNIALLTREAALCETLKGLRWLAPAMQDTAVVVNIPSASLLFSSAGKIVLESRIIPGKPSTRTPTLTSEITEVVIYPYWHVPAKIARRELLPMIKKNHRYLADNNFQVLNKAGKVVDPEQIIWSSLTANNFPYTLRQSTGCDNSLGLIKLNFYNPYNVYLHDTPWKLLFGFNKRYFSHGCMRLEKAKELAHFLLQDNSIAVDTVNEKRCLRNQAPATIPIPVKTPVFVLYYTAWVDEKGVVRFFDDIYHRSAEINTSGLSSIGTINGVMNGQ